MKKNIVVIVLITIFVCLYGQYRDTMYVDCVNGSVYNNGRYETNQGSLVGPKASIQGASWSSNPGDLIIVANGNYKGNPNLDVVASYGAASGIANGMPSTQATYTSLGLSGSPLGEHKYDPLTWVTVQPKHNWNEVGYEADANHTIFDGNDNTDRIGLSITNAEYVKVEGFEIRGVNFHGISIGSGSSDIIIENMWIHNIAKIYMPITDYATWYAAAMGRDGIDITTITSYITINRNIIHDVGRLHPEVINTKVTPADTIPADIDPETGLDVAWDHIPIYLNDDTTSTFYGYADEQTTFYGSHDHAIYVHGGYQRITNNIVYDIYSGYGMKFEVGPECVAIGNTFANPGLLTAGNIIVFFAGAPEYTFDCLIQNNIFKGSYRRGVYVTSGTEDNNIYLVNNACEGNDSSIVASTGRVYDAVVSHVTEINSKDSVNAGLDSDFMLTASSTDLINAGENTIYPLEQWDIVEGGSYYAGTLWTRGTGTIAAPYSAYGVRGNARSGTYDIGADEYVVEGNQPPYFTSTPLLLTKKDSIYTYTAIALDANVADTITLIGTTIPSWLSFLDSTGVLSGIPDSTNIGISSVLLKATDGADTTTQSFNITVWQDTPDSTESIIFASNPILTCYIDTVFTDTITVLNTDSIFADTIPSWLTFVQEEYTEGSANIQSALLDDTSYINLGKPDSLTQYVPQQDALEIELDFLIRPSVESMWGTLFSINGGEAVNKSFSFYIHSDGKMKRYIGGNKQATTSSSVADSTWKHFHTIIPDSTAGVITIIDGDTLTYDSDAIGSNVGIEDCYIGIMTISDIDGLEGEVANIKVYSGNGVGRTLAWSDDLDGETVGTWVGTETYGTFAEGTGSGTTPNPLHGYLSGTPSITDVGFNYVSLRGVREDSTATQSYSITVSSENTAPEFISLVPYKIFYNDTIQWTSFSISDQDTFKIVYPVLDHLKYIYKFEGFDEDDDDMTITLDSSDATVGYTNDYLWVKPTNADVIYKTININDGVLNTQKVIKIMPMTFTTE